MKRHILSILLNIYTTKLRRMRMARFGQDKPLSIALLPPAAFGSLGDEAMVTASIEYLREQGVKRFGLISCNLSRNWDRFNPVSEDIEICHHLLSNSWQTWFQFAHVVSRYDQFYCIGADLMDGYYSVGATLSLLKYVSLAAKTGAKTSILGFSFNEKPAPKVINAFQDLPQEVRLYARDPASHNRLTHHIKRSINLVADLAFLLHPAGNPQTLLHELQWIKSQHNKNRIVIGINANYQVFKQLEEQEIDDIINIYVNTLIGIHSKNNNTSFVLVPHDFRNPDNKSSDIGLSEAIFEALPIEIQSDCMKISTPFSAAEIKAVAGNLDIVLSGRMHFAIACLGQGTPTACITYQGKFEGLFKHFDLEGVTIDPAKAIEPGKLFEFLMPFIEKREDIRKHIKLKLPQIQNLAKANFNEA